MISMIIYDLKNKHPHQTK